MKLRKQRRDFYRSHQELYSTPWRRISWYSCKGYRLIQGEIGVVERFTFFASPKPPDHRELVSTTALKAGLEAVAKCIGPDCTRKMKAAIGETP